MKDQLSFDSNAPARPAPIRREAALSLPVDPTERGYEMLRHEQADSLRKLEVRFGVILNRRVRVTLAGIPDEFEGKLVLDQLLHPSSRDRTLRLRIGVVSFDHSDIESCSLIGTPGDI